MVRGQNTHTPTNDSLWAHLLKKYFWIRHNELLIQSRATKKSDALYSKVAITIKMSIQKLTLCCANAQAAQDNVLNVRA